MTESKCKCDPPNNLVCFPCYEGGILIAKADARREAAEEMRRKCASKVVALLGRSVTILTIENLLEEIRALEVEK